MLFTVSALITKQTRPEIALYISIAGGVFILLGLTELITGLVSSILTLADGFGIDSKYILISLKAVGIGYMAHFASGVCTDAGESALAAKVELAGKLMILALALPIVGNILLMLQGLLQI